MRLIITTLGVGLVLVACSGVPAPAASPTLPGSSPTGGATQTAGISPTAAVTPDGGGVVGPVFTGSLVQAFPPVLGGEQVQVHGPVAASEMENLDASTLGVFSDLGFEASGVEAAFATESSVFIFAFRFAGVDSTTIDSTFIAAQDAAPGTSNFRVVTIAGRNVHAWDTIIGTSYSWVNGDILFVIPFSTEQGAEQAIASMPLPTVALQAGGEVLVDVLIDLTLVGGPNAGAYHGETSSGGCSRNALGDNQFGLQFTDDANADGFTSLQLVVSDAAAAEAGATEDFFATVQIGPMFEGTSYNIEPEDGDGTGSVSIQPSGNDNATVALIGETADGVAFEATVTCNVIFDFSSGD